METSAQIDTLAKRLLGQTSLVEKLAHALALARSVVGSGLSYVTLAGELLEPDGTLTVGPRNVSTGLILRRSQLRAIQSQLEELNTAIDAGQKAGQAKLDEQIAAQQRLADRCSTEHQQAAEALAENRVAVNVAEQRRGQLDQQRTALEGELRDAQQQHESETLGRLTEAQAKRKDRMNVALAEMESAWAVLSQQIVGNSKPGGRRPTAKPPKSRSSWPRARNASETSTPV